MDTPATPMYGGFLHIYAPVPDESAEKRFQRLRWHIEQNLDASPVFRRVILPLCAQGMVAVGVFVLVYAWNEFLFAFIFTTTSFGPGSGR